jgi:hypothetical protein
MLNGSKALRVAVLVHVHAAALLLLARAWQAGTIWVWLAGALAGWVALDLITLFVHWTLDNWFTPATPVIGGIVFFFRQHHARPMAMFERGFVDNNFENALLGFAAQTPPLLFGAGPFVSAMMGFMSLWCGWITTVHKAAHVDRPSPLARRLQRARLLIDRRYHDVHHEGAGSHYGLLAGWCEPVVEALHVFELLEFVIVRLTGRIPVHPRLASTWARAQSALPRCAS